MSPRRLLAEVLRWKSSPPNIIQCLWGKMEKWAPRDDASVLRGSSWEHKEIHRINRKPLMCDGFSIKMCLTWSFCNPQVRRYNRQVSDVWWCQRTAKGASGSWTCWTVVKVSAAISCLLCRHVGIFQLQTITAVRPVLRTHKEVFSAPPSLWTASPSNRQQPITKRLENIFP